MAFRITVVILSASCLPSPQSRVSNKEFVGFKYCS